MRRILAIFLLVALSLAIAGCGEFGQRYDGNDGDDAAANEERQITDERFDDEVRERDGCTEVEEFESEGSTHVEEDVDYEDNPPHSGDHNPVPADWGLYDETQSDEATVHNLEHGHIVITHKGLSAEQEEELLDAARINPFHLLVMPREDNPKDGVYYTAWTAQLYCERPSEAALQYMVDNWRDQGPELFTDDPGGAEMGSEQRDEG